MTVNFQDEDDQFYPTSIVDESYRSNPDGAKTTPKTREHLINNLLIQDEIYTKIKQKEQLFIYKYYAVIRVE